MQPRSFIPSPTPTLPDQPLPPRNSIGIFVSQDTIDFGILSATNPITRTLTLKINSSNDSGLSVSSFIDKALSDENKKLSIPNTHCDNTNCTHAIASTWENLLTYGYGYRCDSPSCVEDFLLPNTYKPFAMLSAAQIPQHILQSYESGQKEARITFKVNISTSQEIGIYKNIATFVVAPNL